MAIVNLPHHKQQEFCTSRSPYRQGKKLTAVKVYTVNDESVHLLLYNVPAINLNEEVCKLCVRYGDIILCTPVAELEEKEEFTDTFHIKYSRIQAARFAKRQLDGKSFFGGILHVCYAPELETVEETRSKLTTRRCEIAKRLKQNSSNDKNPQIVKQKTFQRSKKHPALPVSTETSAQQPNQNEYKSIREQKIVQGPEKSGQSSYSLHTFQHDSGRLNFTESIPKELSTTEKQVLRFVPRSVATTKRIVFHSNISEKKRHPEDISEELMINKRIKNS